MGLECRWLCTGIEGEGTSLAGHIGHHVPGRVRGQLQATAVHQQRAGAADIVGGMGADTITRVGVGVGGRDHGG